ncbi:MAG: MFS transporter [Candidatus Methanofastidiosia archaeon]|jgi:MFS family permease
MTPSEYFTGIHTFWMQHIHSFYVSVRFSFALAHAFTTTIVTVYLLSKGLSYANIGAVWGVTLFFSTVLDFPTGNFADLYGRKLAFVVGVTSIGAGDIIFGLSTEIWMFFVGAFFVGLGSAQVSGSISSWVVDEQTKAKKEDTISKIFGDGSATASIGGILGGVIIGTFFAGPLELLYFVAGVLFVLTGVFVFVSIPDNYGEPKEGWIGLPKEVLSHYVHSLPLIILSVLLILILGLYTVYLFIWQPLALEMGILKGDLGYLYALYMGGSAVGAVVMGRVSKRYGEIFTLVVSLGLAAAGFFMISIHAGFNEFICGLVVLAFGYGGVVPVFYAWMNTFIPSSIRASASSLIHTIGTGGMMVLQVVMGVFIEAYGLKPAAFIAAAFAGIGILALFYLSRRDKQVG